MGDIQLQCSGSNPGAVLAGNLSIFLPVSVTNRVDTGNLTRDAVVLVDYGSGFVPTGIPGLVTNQIIAFNGLNITVPPSGRFALKITNIRANLAQAGGGFSPRPIQAQLAFSTPVSIPIDQSLVIVAYAQIGLFGTLYDRGITCTGSRLPEAVTLSSLFNAGTAFASTRLTEGFALAFLPRSATEDNGTRFLVTYSGFPSNARVFVPDFVAGSDAVTPTSGGDLGGAPAIGRYQPGSGTLLLARVLGADSNGAGGVVAPLQASSGPISLNSVTEVSLSGGSGYAVYEVVDANPAAQETAQFPTFIGLPNVTAPAVAQENVSFAPVSSVLAASAAAPITRFIPSHPPSDCTVLGDCGAQYFPRLNVPFSPIQLNGVAGGAMTGQPGYIPVQNAGGGILNWTATVNYLNGSGFLLLSDTSGQNGTSIRVWADPKGLAAGTYRANIVIDSGLGGSVTVPVTLTVTAATAPSNPPPPATPAVVVSRVVNAATFDATPLVSGSLGTLMGSHLSGRVVAVTFDSNPATLLYTSDNQINLQVPELGSKTSASLVVTVDGSSSTPQVVALAPAWPSVFSNGILNQDNSINGRDSAARPGTVLQIFATGIPAGATVSAQIGGRRDLVPFYAGAAPTVPGMQQVNVPIPDDAEPGIRELVICATTGGQQYCSAATTLVVQ